VSRSQELLHALGESLGSSATVRNVFGDPVKVDHRTIIPVAKIGYGMGGGGAERNSDMGGGGGGGAMRAVPVGVVEVTPEGTRFIHFSGTKRYVGALGLGFFAGYVIARFTRR
jgi:uncharacterized spore protein YtfJ